MAARWRGRSAELGVRRPGFRSWLCPELAVSSHLCVCFLIFKRRELDGLISQACLGSGVLGHAVVLSTACPAVVGCNAAARPRRKREGALR